MNGEIRAWHRCDNFCGMDRYGPVLLGTEPPVNGLVEIDMSDYPWVHLFPEPLLVLPRALSRIRKEARGLRQDDGVSNIEGNIWCWRGSVEAHTDSLNIRGAKISMGLIFMNRRTVLHVEGYPNMPLPVGSVFAIDPEIYHGTCLSSGNRTLDGLHAAVIWDLTIDKANEIDPHHMRAQAVKEIESFGKRL